MVPNVLKKIYGKEHGTQLYGFLFTYTGIASILTIVLQTEFLNQEASSYNLFFNIFGALSVVSLLTLLTLFKEDKYFKSQDD